MIAIDHLWRWFAVGIYVKQQSFISVTNFSYTTILSFSLQKWLFLHPSNEMKRVYGLPILILIDETRHQIIWD